jgi:hypothetical protein
LKEARARVINRSNPRHHSLRRSRADAVLRDSSLERELVGDVARFDSVAFPPRSPFVASPLTRRSNSRKLVSPSKGPR